MWVGGHSARGLSSADGLSSTGTPGSYVRSACASEVMGVHVPRPVIRVDLTNDTPSPLPVQESLPPPQPSPLPHPLGFLRGMKVLVLVCSYPIAACPFLCAPVCVCVSVCVSVSVFV